MQLDVYSAGRDVGNIFAIRKGWKEITAGNKGGINLVVMNEANGSVISTQQFRTDFGENIKREGKRMLDFIEEIPLGAVVCVAVCYDGSHLSTDAKHALMWLGSEDVSILAPYGSWALIGIKGAPPGQAIEVVSNDSPAQVWARIRLQPFHRDILEITAESTGNSAVISVNGSVVDAQCTLCAHGLCLALVDRVTGNLMCDVLNHFLHGLHDPFVGLINSLSARLIVAIAKEKDAFLSEAVWEACRKIGSAMIEEINGGTWAIVGSSDAPVGSMAESYKDGGADTAAKATFIATTEHATCRIVMQSLEPTGVGSRISVNGINTTSTEEGHLIVVLKDGDCSIESHNITGTPDDLETFIDRVPYGRIVLVVIARNHTDNGTLALESIGSAQAASVVSEGVWGVVGKKGAIRGSVVELSHGGEGSAAEVRIDTEGFGRLKEDYLILYSGQEV